MLTIRKLEKLQLNKISKSARIWQRKPERSLVRARQDRWRAVRQLAGQWALLLEL